MCVYGLDVQTWQDCSDISTDFDKVFAPVSKYATLRGSLPVVAVKDMENQQLDIKTAFLNGVLEVDVYIKRPAGYEESGRDFGCHLRRITRRCKH